MHLVSEIDISILIENGINHLSFTAYKHFLLIIIIQIPTSIFSHQQMLYFLEPAGHGFNKTSFDFNLALPKVSLWAIYGPLK